MLANLPWTQPLAVRIVGNLSSPDWLTLGATASATIIGAIIGAGIAYFIARQTARENRAAMNLAKRDAEEAATLRALLKVTHLINLVAGYYEVIERTIRDGRKNLGDPKAPIWAVLIPLVGKPVEIHITSDDLIVFARARAFAYITELLSYASQYNSTAHAIAAYGNLRDVIATRLAPLQMEGLIGRSVPVPPELVPQIAAVNDLAERLWAEVQDLNSDMTKIVNGFGPIVQRYFGDPHFPVPSFVKADVNDPDSGRT